MLKPATCKRRVSYRHHLPSPSRGRSPLCTHSYLEFSWPRYTAEESRFSGFDELRLLSRQVLLPCDPAPEDASRRALAANAGCTSQATELRCQVQVGKKYVPRMHYRAATARLKIAASRMAVVEPVNHIVKIDPRTPLIRCSSPIPTPAHHLHQDSANHKAQLLPTSERMHTYLSLLIHSTHVLAR